MNPILISSILSGLLQSSLLVGAAWLLTLAHRRTSAARRSTAYRLTMAAAMALLVIVVGNAALSMVPSHTNAGIPGQAALPDGPGTIAENSLLQPSGGAVLTSPEPVTAIPVTDARRSLSLLLSADSAHWLTAGWLIGAALVLLTWIRSLAARQILLHHSENATRMPWLQSAGKIKGWPLVDQVRLFPQEITPCVWGVFKTILVLPASASSWPPAKLQLVLAHECAHLLRRDPFWQMLCRVFVALLWFHPLAWSLARRSQAADEQAADDTVLRTECDGPSYAGLLVECARQFALPPALQATASAMASPTSLTRRVEAVLNPAADRRPANYASLLTWAALITLQSAISSYAAPELSTAPDEEAQIRKVEATLPDDEQNLFPPITPMFQSGLKASAKSMMFPSEKPSARKTYVLKGSVKLSAHDFTISAEEMTLEMKPGQNPPSPPATVDPANLESAVATGSVVVEGQIGGVVLSAKADSLVYTKNSPEQGLILTGWPSLQTGVQLIEGLERDSKIILGSNDTPRFERCRISSLPETNQQSLGNPVPTETPAAPPTVPPTPDSKDAVRPSAAPAPPEPAPAADQPAAPPSDPPSDPPTVETIDTPPIEKSSTEAPKRGPFEWQILQIDGLDYVGVDQIKTFYRFSTLYTEESGSFELRAASIIIKGSVGSDELSINNVRVFLKLPVEKSKENSLPMISRQDLAGLLEPILRPTSLGGILKVSTVVIDPGHGGHDFGASSPQGKESVYTLDTAQRLARSLERLGIKAVLTRNEDRSMSLDERVIFAAKQPEAILISLHFNSGPATQQGIQTFYLGAPSLAGKCVALATAVHANTLYKTRSTDGGIRSAKFSVLSGYRKEPGILIECGYLSNPEEAARIDTEAYRQSIAEAIAGGVQNYRKALRRNPNPRRVQPPGK